LLRLLLLPTCGVQVFKCAKFAMSAVAPNAGSGWSSAHGCNDRRSRATSQHHTWMACAAAGTILYSSWNVTAKRTMRAGPSASPPAISPC